MVAAAALPMRRADEPLTLVRAADDILARRGEPALATLRRALVKGGRGLPDGEASGEAVHDPLEVAVAEPEGLAEPEPGAVADGLLVGDPEPDKEAKLVGVAVPDWDPLAGAVLVEVADGVADAEEVAEAEDEEPTWEGFFTGTFLRSAQCSYRTVPVPGTGPVCER